MKNYQRAIQIALKFRWSVVGAIVCSLMIALLWGGNIGALYPVLQIAFKSQSLQTWNQNEIDVQNKSIALKQEKVKKLPPDSADVEAKRRILVYEIDAEKRKLRTQELLNPVINHAWVPRDPFTTVLYIVVALFLATILKGVFVFYQAMFVAAIEQRVTFELRRQFFHQALRMDMDSFVEESTSGLLSRFNTDILYLAAGIKNLFGSAIREPLKITACLIGASWVNWRLLVFSLIFTPVVGFLVQRLAGSIKRANRRILEEFTQLYGVLTETFNGIQTVQAYTLEQSERNKFRRVSKECFRKAMRIAFYNSLTKPVTEAMGIGMISIALLTGAYLTLNGETHLFGIRMSSTVMDTTALLIFYAMLIGATEPARKLSDIFNSIQAGIAASDRLFPLLDQEPKIVNPTNPIRLPVKHRQIVFDKVNFHYNAEVPVLQDIDLTVDFGETLAIVGPNGCGKSTLLQLIPRFFDPISGHVRIDHADVKNVRLRDLRERIGFVVQQAYLFDDTIYQNIACGNPNASLDQVHAAAKTARAHRFITEKISDGYDTLVGAGGCRLSGGQRQRIALARAIIRDPEILILDEATSQIDIESEQMIKQALTEFAKNRTVFMITHRPATLGLANRILVMNSGRIEDLGSHDELIARCPLYQRLYQVQFKQSA